MSRAKQIYKCPVCDTVVEVLEKWGLELVCCGRTMALLRAKPGHGGRGEHALTVQADAAGVRVRVGAPAHPMTETDRIEWIELLADGKSYRQFLRPGDPPEAVFALRPQHQCSARAYCSRHGLWRSDEAKAAATITVLAAPAQMSLAGA